MDVIPIREDADNRIGHKRPQPLDAAAMECWLHQLALANPDLTTGIGNQSVPKHRLGGVKKERVFIIVLMVFLKDSLNIIRMVDDNNGKVQQAKLTHIPVCACHMREEL